MKVLVGSTNPVKLEAARAGFSAFYDEVEVVGVPAPSGVADMPLGQATFDGARQRAAYLQGLNERDGLGAAFVAGIEGGALELDGRWFALGAVCVRDAAGREGVGTSPWFALPEVVVPRLLAGEELGAVIDALSGETDTKRRGGAIGFLTGGALDRASLYAQGVVAALVPLRNPGLYSLT